MTKLDLEVDPGVIDGRFAIPVLYICLELSCAIVYVFREVDDLGFGEECLTCFSKELKVFDKDIY